MQHKSFRFNRICLILIFYLMLFSSLYSEALALPENHIRSQDTQPPLDVQSTTGPTPPKGAELQGMSVDPNIVPQISAVPAYIWTHGCGPTVAGMIIGYWDTRWFGKLVPGDAHSHSVAVNEMIASSEGSSNHYVDYSLPLDMKPNLLPDRSEFPAGDEHISNSLADFMRTSFSMDGNYYGWSWYLDFGPALRGYVNYANATYGASYYATTSNYYMYNGSLNWDLLRNEIDAGRPLALLVDSDADGYADHFVTAVGYDDSTGIQKYAALNTWDTDIHWYNFAVLAPGAPWGILAGTTFKISSFQDTPVTYWAWESIERLYSAGITGGCNASPLQYCPDATVTRAQMAVFLEKGVNFPSAYSPPNVAPTFTDTAGHWAEDWIEALRSDGITGGCGPNLYCLESPVTRAQMAVFLLKSKYGLSYTPPAVGSNTGFTDVPVTHWAAPWIKQLAAEGITGGCGTNLYCPENPVTRAQMAVFLVRAFNLP